MTSLTRQRVRDPAGLALTGDRSHLDSASWLRGGGRSLGACSVANRGPSPGQLPLDTGQVPAHQVSSRSRIAHTQYSKDVRMILIAAIAQLGISTFWQGTFVGSFIIIAVLFDRLRTRTSTD